jgi:hypothetical protein
MYEQSLMTILALLRVLDVNAQIPAESMFGLDLGDGTGHE